MLRPLIVLIALAAGGGAAWIATQEPEPEPVVVAPAPASVEMTAVLVAAQDVARGRELTVDALRWQKWPSDEVPATFIDRSARPDALSQLAGRFASRPITNGEPIADHLLTQTPGGFLAAMLAPGKRAVGIQTSAQSTAGGFILPNDRVDVLHTTEATRRSGEAGVRSRTFLRGVRVLAIDQTTTDIESGSVLGKTATLELTEAQVEAVTAAQATGTLSLSLRPMEEAPLETSMETVKPPKTIRLHRGTTIEDVVLN